jgi:CRP-like cAMP-binding protein
MPRSRHTASDNQLLAALSKKDWAAIEGDFEPVSLNARLVLQEPGQKVRHVYFPTDGVVSMINEQTPGEVVEVATIGREGMSGIHVFLRGDEMPSRCIVQVPGEGFRMRPRTFLKLADQNERFRTLLSRYALALMNQIAQSTACNRFHEVQERCARWLLQTHDRVDGDTFQLTQEFLAQMLGVNRPTVSVAAGMLQQAGLISYTRGVITVKKRKGLEEASCSCYRTITREYDRLLK